MSDLPRPVTVSVVSHGQWKLVAPLLEQLSACCASHIDKLVLTINKPEDIHGLSSLQLGFELTTIVNAQPLGFGANHNRAFVHCATPWFLVLNPDIRLDADVLGAMLSQAQAGAGLVSPRIREPGHDAPEPFRTVPTPLELLRRRSRHHQPPARPAWVAGMFMLLRAQAFRQTGGFDERFHMYCEDVDLCARLQLAQWGLQITPDVEVLHLAQRASQAQLRPLFWHLRSLMQLWTSAGFWRWRRWMLAQG